MRYVLILSILCSMMGGANTVWAESNKARLTKPKPITFVMQMTASEEIQQRRAFLQISKVLEDIGADKVNIEVVAYEGGILSLLANNPGTASLVASLSRQGVKFKACRISMNASDLTESDFPLEVEFVPAGAPEMIRLQMRGAKYWRP